MDQALFQYLLRMGDSTLVLSQRLCEWTGHGPVLEEEMAVANTALDLLGQARMWLTLAGEVEGLGRDEDALAYLRDAPEYRNVLLAERPNGNYGTTVARQFAFDVWHYMLLEQLQNSVDERVAAIAAKALKEVAYHARRSSDVLIRLGDGTEFSHNRMQEALEEIWPYVGELFIDDAVTEELAARDVVPLNASLREAWESHAAQILTEATLRMPAIEGAFHPAHRGGVHGRHTEALGYLLAEMQHLQRSYPGARW